MARNGDIRTAFNFAPSKRRRVESPIKDNIIINTSGAPTISKVNDISPTREAQFKNLDPFALSDDEVDDDLPTPRPLRKPTAPFKGPNLSFKSTSSLSPPPPSSQASALSTHSRRVWLHGQQVVTNSSSDGEMTEQHVSSDDATSNDDDDDIELLIARKRQAIAANREEQSRPRDESSESIQKPRLRPQRQTKASRGNTYPSPPTSTVKNSLADILKQQKRHQAMEARLRNLEQQDKTADQKYQTFQSMDANGGDLTESAAAAVLDEDDADFRLKVALKRMDALEQEVKFYFFDSVPEHDLTRLAFPLVAERWDKCMVVLKDETSRKQAARSGFWAELCGRIPLPPEVQEWLLGEVLFEDEEDLAEAYVHILACSDSRSHHELLDQAMLRDSMTRLGAKDDIIYEDTNGDDDDFTTDEHRRPARAGRRGLPSFLLLLSQLRKTLSPRTRGLALYFCSLILVDEDVATNIVLTAQAQRTVADLLDSAAAADLQSMVVSTAKRIFLRLDGPILVSRMLYRLPCSTHRMVMYKRQMAYAYTTGNAVPTADVFDSLTTWKVIDSVLDKPEFTITAKTDYAVLGARISILDLAVGNGFSTPFRPTGKAGGPEQPQDGQRAHDSDETGQKAALARFFDKRRATGGAAVASSDEEKHFNAQVDLLAARLRRMSSLIRDAGAAHVRRTECKVALDRLVVRLEGTVRTRARPRVNVFSGGRSFK